MTRSQTASIPAQCLGYLRRSQARSSGLGTTKSNQVVARYVYALA